MKSALLLIAGVVAGFFIAHQVSKTPKGLQFLIDLDSKAKEFSDAVVEGFKTREAELRTADPQGVISDLASHTRAK
jgi:hypothetical protein